MALSLDQITTSKKIIPSKHSPQKEKVLRPWETFDQLGNQTRTIAAKEAVLKAQKIVMKNNILVDQIKKGDFPDNSFQATETYLSEIEEEIAKEVIETEISLQPSSGNFITIDYVHNVRDLEKVKKNISHFDQSILS